LLKALRFAAALAYAVSGTARAETASDLVVGSVRDRSGAVIDGAQIRALDASGRTLGSDRTDAEGTFAIRLPANAQTIEVRCPHCDPTRVRVANASELVVVVRRYAALESDVPAAADLAALPYPRIVDALGLIPFTLVAGDAISDRGLGGGTGLIVDDGAPLVDLATGSPSLVDFPDRYVRSVAVSRAADAFRYGIDAGGGRFSLDQLDGDASSASTDVGAESSLTLEPALGVVHPSYGVSSDGGTLTRRGDLDVATPFAGGFLRAGAGTGLFRASDDLARNVDLARIAYATASRRYRTAFDLSASRGGVADRTSDSSNYHSAYLAANVRVEHPGPVSLAFGATATQRSAFYAPLRSGDDLTGRVAAKTLYAEANTGNERVRLRAGVGATDVTANETLASSDPSGERLSLLPAVSVRASLGAGAYVRGGFSEALRVPSLLESDAAVPARSLALERDELSESALGFDRGRVRAEATVFRQFRHGFAQTRLDGIGASVAWQIAPLVSVRAWSLHDAPLDYVVAAPSAANASRQIVWATYGNGEGLRFDAIAHRDAGSGHGALGVDGDAFVPVAAHVALDVGTSVRDVRKYYFGLRAR